MHFVYAPELCVTIVFDFSWDDCNTLEKLETMYANFWGVNKVHYGLCESGELKNTPSTHLPPPRPIWN